ncbi:PREDICTED: histone-lysine N-methyltransferase ASHH3 isoform X2 [Tarenaya hassleriana]|uniref:histone-lysine N-methyltransferase ASHH3 isoform X2 n=1 Tax=Tarenaya hassleriana TaxID=28532 RepID=UPI00053C870B|nr:PREDICTED: histone-lysine N-methyltransferase ASHH3 isoform X2 [Tarenaya hassleriana]
MPAAKKIFDRNHIGQAFSKLLKQIGESEDFELPDWLNKGKPTPYVFIRRNIYLTKKFKRRLEDDGIFCSCSPSPDSSTVCGSNCHCGMLFSSCSSSCRCKCGSECLNKPFQQRHVKKMKLVQTEKCGSGIVTDEDVKQGEFIIEYVGEVIDDKTCEGRLWNMKHRGETNFYLCEINRDMVIDATHKGNKSRYINHSCNPNTEMQKWIIDGETRIGIFATRDIKKGQHLTYDYQFVQFGADQDCHCGAVGCRRKLGVKPSKPKTHFDAALNLVAEAARTPPKVHQNGSIHAVWVPTFLQENHGTLIAKGKYAPVIASAWWSGYLDPRGRGVSASSDIMMSIRESIRSCSRMVSPSSSTWQEKTGSSYPFDINVVFSYSLEVFVSVHCWTHCPFCTMFSCDDS